MVKKANFLIECLKILFNFFSHKIKGFFFVELCKKRWFFQSSVSTFCSGFFLPHIFLNAPTTFERTRSLAEQWKKKMRPPRTPLMIVKIEYNAKSLYKWISITLFQPWIKRYCSQQLFEDCIQINKWIKSILGFDVLKRR